ncbi:MAG TPA: hypothetical protein PLY64_04165 [Dokdonella sp.]|nr:hypothetical protein [Dokdonella sp.]
MSERPFPFLKFPRALPSEVRIPIRVVNFNEIHADFLGSERVDQASRCIDCGNPYCSWGCPLGNRIPQWLKLAREGRVEDAATLMHETNPLPEICGRVCPHDRLCEGVCTLEQGFGAVSIGAIERSITDEAIRRGWWPGSALRSASRRSRLAKRCTRPLSAAILALLRPFCRVRAPAISAVTSRCWRVCASLGRVSTASRTAVSAPSPMPRASTRIAVARLPEGSQPCCGAACAEAFVFNVSATGIGAGRIVAGPIARGACDECVRTCARSGSGGRSDSGLGW